MNFILVRQRPNWLTFNLEDTRSFCKRFDYPENMIIDFARDWDAALSIDYRNFRHAMQQIALASITTCADSTLVSSLDVNALNDEDLVYFIDDDDWVAPDLFKALRSWPLHDGFLWGSIRVGFGPVTIQKRAFDKTVYTNNYCVTGRLLRRLGIEPLFEHFNAQTAFDAGSFSVKRIERYLSCANKHPCCTMNIKFNPAFDFHADMAAILRGLSAPIDEEISWIRPY